MIPDGLRRFALGWLAWTLGALLLLGAINLLTAERFFIASFLGFLAVRELTPPETATSRWRTPLYLILMAGSIGVAYIVIRQVIALL